MNARTLAVVAAAALVANGCSGWSSTGATPPATGSDVRMVRVPGDGDAGTIIPRLHRAGLLITVPDVWNANSFDGQSTDVISPRPGTRVPEGSAVAVGIRLGPIGSPGQTTGLHVVPTVIGQTLRTATTRIEAAELAWTVHASALPPTSTDDLWASYCVTAQQPLGKTRITITRGSSIIMVELRARPC